MGTFKIRHKSKENFSAFSETKNHKIDEPKVKMVQYTHFDPAVSKTILCIPTLTWFFINSYWLGQNLALQNHNGTAQPVLDGHRVTWDACLIQNRVGTSLPFFEVSCQNSPKTSLFSEGMMQKTENWYFSTTKFQTFGGVRYSYGRVNESPKMK
jgi:hypothetical protein